MSTLTLPDRLARGTPEPPQVILGIANASATEGASVIFCYIGVGNTADAQTVWLDQAAR